MHYVYDMTSNVVQHHHFEHVKQVATGFVCIAYLYERPLLLY